MPTRSAFLVDDNSTDSRRELVRALLLAEKQAAAAEAEAKRLRDVFERERSEEERSRREAEELLRQREEEEAAWEELTQAELLLRARPRGSGWQGALGSEIGDVMSLDALIYTSVELEKTKARLAELRARL